jgi:hypothetical protein
MSVVRFQARFNLLESSRRTSRENIRAIMTKHTIRILQSLNLLLSGLDMSETSAARKEEKMMGPCMLDPSLPVRDAAATELLCRSTERRTELWMLTLFPAKDNVSTFLRMCNSSLQKGTGGSPKHQIVKAIKTRAKTK